MYCDAFVAPGRHELDNRPVVLNTSGARGVAVKRLLVTEDSGYDRLLAEVTGPWPGVVFVLERASRSSAFMRDQAGWGGHSEMAMVLRDTGALTAAELPDGLDFRPVSRVQSLGTNAVPLRLAADVAVASDPTIGESVDQVVEFLSGLPSSAQVFAAIDKNGVACATSACHVFGEYAQIFFVNTEPAYRRRGIGQAMTIGAVAAAASLGARHAILHATADGTSVYQRVGFDPVGMLTRYSRAE